MHDSLASSLSEGVIEVGAVVLGQVVSDERLTTVLVDSLQDLRENHQHGGLCYDRHWHAAEIARTL